MVRCATCPNEAKTDILIEPYHETEGLEAFDSSVCWECYNNLVEGDIGIDDGVYPVCPDCSGTTPVEAEKQSGDWVCPECDNILRL